MDFKAVSFHEACIHEPTVRLAARLGFNVLEMQTERSTLFALKRVRELADRQGLFDLARELGMAVSIWSHDSDGCRRRRSRPCFCGESQTL